MIEDRDLLERLKAVDVPPTRLTTPALVEAGRRRVVHRRTLRTAGGVALAAVLAFAVPPVAGRLGGQLAADRGDPIARCDATRLPRPDGMVNVQAEAVDPTGEYIVGSAVTRQGADLYFRPVLWTGGQPRILGTIGASVRASDVDSHGTVVAVGGNSDRNGRWATVIRYAGGVPEKLVPPAGDWAFAATPRIDANGDVLAVAYRASDPTDPVFLIWPAGSATATRMDPPAGGTSAAAATDAGTVIADVESKPTGVVSISVWDKRGSSRQLEAPAGAGSNFVARGDWVAANVGSGTVARWSLRTGKMTDTGVTARVTGINALGWVLAGQSLQRDGVVVELAALDGLIGTPADLSDTGIVVGSVYDLVVSGATPATDGGDSPGSSNAGPITWKCGR